MSRARRIAGGAAILAALVVAGLAFPFASDALRGTEAASLLETDAQRQDRAQYAFDLHKLGLKPLSETCAAGSPDRVRLLDSGCMSEGLADIDLSTGALRLHPLLEGVYVDARGAPAPLASSLSAAQRESLRGALRSRLPSIPRHVDGGSVPGYYGAIEACLSGSSYLVVRNVSTGDGFAELLADASRTASFRLTNPKGSFCI